MSMEPDKLREQFETYMNNLDTLEKEKRKEMIRQVLEYYDYYTLMMEYSHSWGMGMVEMVEKVEAFRKLFGFK